MSVNLSKSQNYNTEVAIEVVDISKCYFIFNQPHDRLKQVFVSRWNALAHRYLPNQSLTNYYREFWALKNVSFQVPRGEAVGIIGRNGAGKSTLLQMIAGTLSPTSGHVRVNGKVAALLELGSGFSMEFTGRENVYLNASLLGLSKEQTDAKFDEIAAFADIGSFIEQPVKTYSSGMMVRLAFAVQTAVEPDLLIVDEALAVGDARFQKKCFKRLENFRNNGGTLLFVTHDTGTIVEICSSAMMFETGQLLAEGEPRQIAREYHRLLFEDVTQSNTDPSEISNHQTENQMAAQSVEPEVVGNKESLFDAPNAYIARPLLTQKEVRYGTGSVEITLVSIRDLDGNQAPVLETNIEYEIFFHVKYRKDIPHRIAFGFILSSKRGVELYGTKSQQHKLYLPPDKENSTFECCMKIKMTLVPGSYFLSVALAFDEYEKDEFLDCRHDAIEFQVIGNPPCFLTGIVDMDGHLSNSKL